MVFGFGKARHKEVSAQELDQMIRAGEALVVDVLEVNEYADGHIPGAINRPFTDNLAAGGCFKKPSELHAEFNAVLGDTDPMSVVHSCGSGVTACHNLLAMELAGLHGSSLYAGSWSEWCSDRSRPAATGN